MTFLEWVDKPITVDDLNINNYSSDKYKHKIDHISNASNLRDFENNIRHYTIDSTYINRHLWQKKFGEHNDEIDHSIDRTKHINRLLKTAKYDEDIPVYSGINHQDFQGDLMKGGIIHVPAFISGSLIPLVAHQFSTGFYSNPRGESHILKINIPANSHNGSYINEKDSENPGEHEFLIPANNLLKINNTEKHHYNNLNVYIHHAHIMKDDEIEQYKDHPEVQSYIKMREILDDKEIVDNREHPEIKSYIRMKSILR